MGDLQHIFRYSVKGLQGEELSQAELINGRGILGDRAFAFQVISRENLKSLEANFDANVLVPWLSKMQLAVQHDWPSLAKILPIWNPKTKILKLKISDTEEFIEGNVTKWSDRVALSNFVFGFLSMTKAYEKARQPQIENLALMGSSDEKNHFTDSEKGFVSVALQESLKDLEEKFQFPIDIRRFRINFILTGAPAWSELQWSGKKLQIGNCHFEVIRQIGRCPNIDVHPVTGAREYEVFPEMKNKVGHSFFGMRCHVIRGGGISKNALWNLL